MADDILTVGDRPTFKATILDPVSKTAVDLTGATVKFRFKINVGATTEPNATVTDATAGKAEYTMGVNELSAAGNIFWEWFVTDSGNRPFHQNRIPFQKPIRAAL